MEPVAMFEAQPALLEVPVPVIVPGRRWPWLLALLVAILGGAGALYLMRRSSVQEQARRREFAQEVGSHAAPQPVDDDPTLAAADG
jgi:hypothetical protein